MVISRAPLRVSFGGGGTDLPAYYSQFGGVTLSVAIDKFIYVTIEPSRTGIEVTSLDGGISRRQTDLTDSPGSRLPLVIAQQCAPGRSLRIFIAGEVASGSGLGSSSALAVALTAGLGEWAGTKRTAADTAAFACNVEIDQLGSPIGRQDQYASALGGMNLLTYHPDDTVEIQPVPLRDAVRHTLERRLLLFFTGTRRDAGLVLANQRRRSAEGDPQTIAALHAIKGLALDMHSALLHEDLDRFGQLLHESWEQKKRVTSGISTGYIDHCYDVARNAGALGGKIAGAGGGGFLLLYCREEAQAAVMQALAPLGLHSREFGFSSLGVHIVVNDPSLDAEHWKSA